MNYEITVNTSKWPNGGFSPESTRAYPDRAENIGKINLFFSYDGNSREYNNDFVNIPLFITELSLFLDKINSKNYTTWYLGFAPFAHGILDSGALLISSVGGKGFRKGVYDISSPDELAILGVRLDKDIARFGTILTDSAKAEKIVGGLH